MRIKNIFGKLSRGRAAPVADYLTQFKNIRARRREEGKIFRSRKEAIFHAH
jgi:hypothetical protein